MDEQIQASAGKDSFVASQAENSVAIGEENLSDDHASPDNHQEGDHQENNQENEEEQVEEKVEEEKVEEEQEQEEKVEEEKVEEEQEQEEKKKEDDDYYYTVPPDVLARLVVHPGYWGVPITAQQRREVAKKIRNAVEFMYDDEAFACGITNIHVANFFLSLEAQRSLLEECRQVYSADVGVNWAHAAQYKDFVAKVIVRMPATEHRPASLDFPSRVGMGEVTVDLAKEIAERKARDYHCDPTSPLFKHLSRIIDDVAETYDDEVNVWYHPTINYMSDTNLPPHVDEPMADGPGEFVANIVVWCSTAQGDTSLVLFEGPEGPCRYIQAPPCTMYWFNKKMRLLWTHGVYRNRVVPHRLDEAMPHNEARIVITLRGNRLMTEEVELFTQRYTF